MKIHKPYLHLIFLLFTFLTEITFAQQDSKIDFSKSDPWVDSVFNSLTFEEKVGQLFMIAAYSNRDTSHLQYLKKQVTENKIGGLIFFQGSPTAQAKMINELQGLSKTPLLISMDAEWGLGMRLDSTISYPKQLMLGAIQDDELIYEMGQQIALQLKQLGVQINFAPVIDINNNAKNPVINYRSFGESKYEVTKKGYHYMLGMQDQNILATGKHFPGHGDTDSDSHKTLPIITHSKSHLDKIELYPFKQLIDKGLCGIMVAHLFVPALDSNQNKPATLSRKIVSGLLKNELGFEGLIFTDALNMKGVQNGLKQGQIYVEAIKAGNDVLLFPEDMANAISYIDRAVKQGTIDTTTIEKSCKKILYAKKWTGLDKSKPINIHNLTKELNSVDAKKLNIELVESAITLLKNEQSIIPLQRLDTLKVAAVSIGNGEMTTFQKYLDYYAGIEKFSIVKNAKANEFIEIEEKLSTFNLIIISLQNTNQSPADNFGVSDNAISFIEELAQGKKVILDVFANPYALNKLQTKNLQAIVLSFEDSRLSQALSAQSIFGGIGIFGQLPVSLNEFELGTGIQINKAIRMKYTIPEELCIAPEFLIKVDSLAENAIHQGATPGCQVLCAKDGKVFYNKSFGYFTYDSINEITENSVYDLASITKIEATTAALMKLYDEEKLLPDDLLSEHLCFLDNSNKKKIKIDDVLMHQAGLYPWIPFYRYSIDSSQTDSALYSNHFDSIHSVKVANSLFIKQDYQQTIMDSIIRSPLFDSVFYRYSDLGFYLFKEMIEEDIHQNLDKFVDSVFFNPLGLSKTSFSPLEKFDKSEIVPTENDSIFRKQLIQGYVHDPGAAMLGGVSGHAGLFSNITDLATFMQMLLQKGSYGGTQYFKPKTVEIFTTSPHIPQNRRALGFDKPEMDNTKEGPTCHCVSPKSFGHTGFTGTMAWADPESGIVYVFLSNRINPSQDNHKLVEMNVRTEIQQALYDAITKAGY